MRQTTADEPRARVGDVIEIHGHRLGENGRVVDAMHPGLISCSLDTPLRTIARMMATYRVHAILVTAHGEEELPGGSVWGIVSDADLLRAAETRNLDEQPARTIAATPLVTVAATEELARAAQLDRREEGQMNVEEVMSREVITAPPGASLKEAARLLVEHRISGLPVVDNVGHVLGIVSESDVLPKEAGDVGLERAKLEARLVGEAMTAPAVTIDAGSPLGAAARLMIEKGVNRLPVIDDGRLVGIVTRADLVRAFARSDAEIAREIRDDVLVRSMWLDKHSVQVEVADGEVTLAGRLDTRADADMLVALVKRVPGVVAVQPKLAWADGDPEC